MGEVCDPRAIRGDALAALALAVLLAAIGSLRGWPMLNQLHLPDTDDVVRLQQIRDWLGGQPFSDLSQHRLGAAPGLAMHWSRLPDLVPGAIIWALTPVVGRHAAELTAVILWPTLLFAALLWVVASITRVVGQPANARTAIIIAAIGFPVTTLFLPGRIDHHGLQIVLILAIVRALLARARLASGATIGVATAASIVIGMETAPFLLIAASILWVRWARHEHFGGDALGGLGAAMLVALLAARAMFAPAGFAVPACDGFTERVFGACIIGASAALVLGLASDRLPGIRHRLGASVAAGAAIALMLTSTLSSCAAPYGAVDPLVARLWLGHVGEAQPLLSAPFVDALGYCGLMVAGLAAGTALMLHNRRAPWHIPIAFQLGALALTFMQLRGAYLGAVLAAPALATLIGAARTRGAVPLAGAWLGSAGMLYPIAAQAISTPAPAHNTTADVLACTDPAIINRLRALAPGTLMAPMDVGAYALGGTAHRVVAAPYHRNNAGNAAMYRFFLGNEPEAHAIAQRWHVDYVLLCADSFSELPASDQPAVRSVAGRLRAGQAPSWLAPVGQSDGGALLYRLKRDLSALASAH
ncbi:MAG: hypothetical protein ACKVOB_02210 [Sphingomonas sp.]